MNYADISPTCLGVSKLLKGSLEGRVCMYTNIVWYHDIIPWSRPPFFEFLIATAKFHQNYLTDSSYL